MNRQGEVAQKKDSQDGHNSDLAQVKPYLGTDKEAQNLAKLGTLALVGNYESHQQLLAEIHRLEKDQQHFKVVVEDLVKINVTADGLPVHAKVETDASGNIVGLKFDSSKDLEKIVYGNEVKHAQCVAENGVRPTGAVVDANAMRPVQLLDAKKFDAANALKQYS